MAKKSQQIYRLTEEQLAKLVGQGTYPDAHATLAAVRKMEASGGSAAVFYSQFSGFSVLNQNDSSPEAVRRLQSFESRAHDFAG